MRGLVPLLVWLFSPRRRLLWRVLLGVVLTLWLFDRAIYFVTEASWFASLGFAPLFWARARAQGELFAGFSLLALGFMRVFLGGATRFAVHEAPPLRGALSRLEPWRAGASRFSWVAATAWALLLARALSAHWSDFLLLRGAPSGDETALWTRVLPLWTPFLGALWDFSLVLGALTVVAGVGRALPQLASRHSLAPPALQRTLWRLAAWILILRALRYATQILDLERGRPLQSGDIWVSAPLLALGALACLGAAASLWRRAQSAPRPASRLALLTLGALFLPGVMNLLSAPERALWSETAWLRARRERATRAAWNLNFAAPSASAPSAPESAWPVWDEATLLGAQRGTAPAQTGFRNGRVVVWRDVFLRRSGNRWRGVAVGEGAGALAWTARRDADDSTQLTLEGLDLDGARLTRAPASGEAAFFGYEGRSLFGSGDFGVPIASLGAKLAWAWRLRDAFLPFDGANATRLLVWRGATERAQKLAPFWKIGGPARLVMRGQRLFWMLPLCASHANFPGAMPAPNGELEGQNAAGAPFWMLLDAHSGAVSFFTANSPDGDSSNSAASVRARAEEANWRAALPSLLPAREMPAELRAQQSAAPALLRAQIELESALRGRAASSVALLSGGDGARRVQRALSLDAGGWMTLDAPDGAPGERVLRQAKGDFAARVAALDAALSTAQGGETRQGEPFTWSDARAPGGWWIGRAVFGPRRSGGAAPDEWEARRVALTGASASPVGAGDSLDAAWAQVAPASAARVAPGSPSALAVPSAAQPLEARALRAHERAQLAARRGDWPAFARESARVRALLQQLIERAERNAAPKP